MAVTTAKPAPEKTDEAPSAVKVRAAVHGIGPALRGFVRVMRANPLTMIGFVLVVIIMAVALVVGLIPLIAQPILGHPVSVLPYDPNYIPPYPCPSRTIVAGNGSYQSCTLPPSWQHLFGTDLVGRDVFSRVLSALPLDLVIGFSITAIALLLGGGLGLVAGFWDKPGTIGGVVSLVILRLTDVFLAFPSLVLALAIAATLGRNLTASMLAILLTWWPYYVRLVRGEVLVVKAQPYIVAARATGVSDIRIMLRHVLRNILEPITVYYTLDVGTVLVTFSTISFIGIGVQQNIPEWGSMIELYQVENLMGIAPWTILFTGAAIFITVLAFSLLGDGLRDILDPRSRRALAQTAVSTKLVFAGPES